MYKTERLGNIMDILNQKKVVNMRTLENLTFESRSTLRRDLIVLEGEHKIRRKFGQVELVNGNNMEFGYHTRSSENKNSKKIIAELASDFIGNNQALIIDSSTTAAYLEPYLNEKNNLIVITNGLQLAMKINSNPEIKTYIAGGKLRPFSGSIVGDTAREFLGDFHADTAFISCEGINADGVYMASDEQTAIKKQMINQAEHVILLCDHTKINKSDYYRMCDHTSIDMIITDVKPTDAFVQSMEQTGVEVVYENEQI
ncbi:DeoR/GlpR family DNA-binding transcription regulator [Companilactobacillus sp.]|uniref:DeoR/GlpR family DNA-binding transcription regulator n=1 Tax=Companilactobacillus sp. TaxID=2767905 RepID=UPI0025B9B879|nr:DeoR/GlpR family DNA-binding transcription regulator [Companilactobacillus sp.]MCH4009569.1 DeoR/GlpR family DNA-binding transcription regulator [Companilactobacillus sp.]MCH4052755.1 DeoR/GlpR family DNA-binding transcription regulator [Companilactobacillus sp.]MCH4077511.1 DeoR/GlpR family DNA-binding transcription regulator [Companilactobacillus sp.]MCH4126087.1 DeoR/GlpR family DNA-binding transcription regulator [Companilactobacillus sp.]MCI1311795.1 DeoR/GlpR family DNA-binding transc